MESDKPRCEWVRDDIQTATRAALKAMTREGEANAYRIEERRQSPGDTVYLNVERMPSKQGEPDRYKATAIAGLPEGRSLIVHGASTADCVFEARHELLEIYRLDRMPSDTSRDIRERLHRTKFETYGTEP